MSEPGRRPPPSIPEDILLSRLAQSEQMRDFFVQMWLQNPRLAKRVGPRMQDILSPLAVADAPGRAAAPGE